MSTGVIDDGSFLMYYFCVDFVVPYSTIGLRGFEALASHQRAC